MLIMHIIMTCIGAQFACGIDDPRLACLAEPGLCGGRADRAALAGDVGDPVAALVHRYAAAVTFHNFVGVIAAGPKAAGADQHLGQVGGHALNGLIK